MDTGFQFDFNPGSGGSPMPVFPGGGGGGRGGPIFEGGGLPSFDFNPSSDGAPMPSSGGQNQYMSFPSMGTNYSGGGGIAHAMDTPAPGTVPTQGSPVAATTPTKGGVGTTGKQPGGQQTLPSQDPTLTNSLDQWLLSMLGTGLPGFNLSTILPSTGQATAPGTLNAPLNPIEQMLNDFYAGKGGGVNASILPMWNSQIAAMQQPIAQQEAALKEQAATTGTLGSSEFGNSLSNFLSQTATSEQALLGQDTLQALPLMQEQGQFLQSTDQAAINNMLKQFNLDQPANNPILQMLLQQADTYAPSYGKQPSFLRTLGQNFAASLGQSAGSFGMSSGGGDPTSFSIGG